MSVEGRWSYDLYIITDLAGPRGLAPYVEALLAAAEPSVRGRVALQLRDKACEDESLLRAGRALLPLAQRADVPLLINEREHIARALGVGVHLPERATQIGPRSGWLGASVHDLPGVRRRHEADVLVLGPLGAVEGKNPPLSDDEFAHCVALARQPVLGLGGIRTSADVMRALRLGAHGIAVRQTISHAADGGAALRSWLVALDEARAGLRLSTKLRE